MRSLNLNPHVAAEALMVWMLPNQALLNVAGTPCSRVPPPHPPAAGSAVLLWEPGLYIGAFRICACAKFPQHLWGPLCSSSSATAETTPWFLMELSALGGWRFITGWVRSPACRVSVCCLVQLSAVHRQHLLLCRSLKHTWMDLIGWFSRLFQCYF